VEGAHSIMLKDGSPNKSLNMIHIRVEKPQWRRCEPPISKPGCSGDNFRNWATQVNCIQFWRNGVNSFKIVSVC
jgi:hypothetical protein